MSNNSRHLTPMLVELDKDLQREYTRHQNEVTRIGNAMNALQAYANGLGDAGTLSPAERAIRVVTARAQASTIKGEGAGAVAGGGKNGWTDEKKAAHAARMRENWAKRRQAKQAKNAQAQAQEIQETAPVPEAVVDAQEGAAGAVGESEPQEQGQEQGQDVGEAVVG